MIQIFFSHLQELLESSNWDLYILELASLVGKQFQHTCTDDNLSQRSPRVKHKDPIKYGTTAHDIELDHEIPYFRHSHQHGYTDSFPYTGPSMNLVDFDPVHYTDFFSKEGPPQFENHFSDTSICAPGLTNILEKMLSKIQDCTSPDDNKMNEVFKFL